MVQWLGLQASQCRGHGFDPSSRNKDLASRKHGTAKQNKTKQKTKPKQTKNLGGKNEMDSRVFPKYLFTEIILVLFATDV